MKRSIWIIIFLVCSASIVNGQYKVTPNKPFSTLRSTPGFVSINEFTVGTGLHGKTAPYSKQFLGFTSVFGYQINSNFFTGGGLGLSFYDGGLLVPLFLDFRYAFYSGQITPYVFADGGILLKVTDLDDSKLFLNPGAGARYTISNNFAVNIGLGILSQVDGNNRASFVNFKIGGVYLF
jgi:hypothetical protein